MPNQPIDPRRLAAIKQRITPSQFCIEFARSAGPGGQNVNKVNTRATLWFDLDNCPVLTDAEKSTLRRKLGGRISTAGFLRVVSRKHRTQAGNKRAALERFYELLTIALTPVKKRIPTRVSRTQKRRRLDDKRRASQKKALRRSRNTRGDE